MSHHTASNLNTFKEGLIHPLYSGPVVLEEEHRQMSFIDVTSCARKVIFLPCWMWFFYGLAHVQQSLDDRETVVMSSHDERGHIRWETRLVVKRRQVTLTVDPDIQPFWMF